jgi:hypothetical protein
VASGHDIRDTHRNSFAKQFFTFFLVSVCLSHQLILAVVTFDYSRGFGTHASPNVASARLQMQATKQALIGFIITANNTNQSHASWQPIDATNFLADSDRWNIARAEAASHEHKRSVVN